MSGPTTPYIGSTISLISNAGIRYEGTLFSIDTNESTVTLATVQSFGTENRPVEKQVPARPDVYEYIVFRGKDIKDLTVKKEPPKVQVQVQDPAIVKSGTVGSSSSLPPFSSPYQTPGVFSPFGGLPAYNSYPVGYQPPQPFQHENSMPRIPPHMQQTLPGANLLPRNPTPPNLAAELSRKGTASPDLLNQGDVKTQETQTKTTTQHGTQTSKRKPSSRRNSTDKTYEKENKNPEQPGQERSEERPKQDRRGDNRSRGANRRGRRSGFRGPKKEINLKEFEDDYDFESANANFKKEEIEEELQKKLGLISLNDEVEVEGEENAVIQHEQKSFYDKGSSFFDSISCEANDREKNKKTHPSWQEERKLNTETFGTSGFRRGRGGRGRGRGNYRGRGGGRGGYRGRGWYGGRGGRGGRGHRGGGDNRDFINYPLDADTSKLQQNLPSGTNSTNSNQAEVQS